MKEQLEERLKNLKQEFESGEKMLQELEMKRTNLQQTLLRISGAIQVLEEVLASDPESHSDSSLNGDRSTAENTSLIHS
jgi:chromosome segregation ATPase